MENFSIDLILSAFLVFVRVGAMVMTAPFFSSAAFPAQIKIYLSLVTSLLLFSVIPSDGVLISAEAGGVFIAIAIIMEILVGAALGLVGQLVFAGLEMAGMLISLNSALSFANMVDSMTQKQSSIVSNLFTLTAVLVFLSIEGDKVYISALAKSFEVVPVNSAEIHLAGPYMLEIATYLFVIGVQITSPFIIVIFLLDVSLAIFARIMPQANMMFIALPVKVGVGLTLLLLAIPYLPTAFEMMFLHLYDFLADIIGIISPEN